jgi:integrase
VNGHLLRGLQNIAKKAGVEDVTLHKLRRTYISTLVESNKVSVRTAMALAGHSDLASTMRYLRPTTGATLRDAIDTIF